MLTLVFTRLCVSGFMANMQRSQAAQFASPQSGPPVSPHPSPGGPVYPGMGPYSQSGPGGPFGPQGSQYGHQGWRAYVLMGIIANIILHIVAYKIVISLKLSNQPYAKRQTPRSSVMLLVHTLKARHNRCKIFGK